MENTPPLIENSIKLKKNKQQQKTGIIMLKTFENKTEMSDYGINVFRSLCTERKIDRKGQIEILKSLVALVNEKNIKLTKDGYKVFLRSKLNKEGLKASRKIRIGAFYQLAAKGFIK